MASPDENRDILNGSQQPRPGLLRQAEQSSRADLPPQERAGLPPELDLSLSPRVRPYSITDLPGLIRFPRMLRLDMPDSLVMRRSGYADLASALPIVRRDRPVFVADADGQLVGFIRFSP